jgi:transcriptional regulator with PAS, ATPase and Fis domain
VDKLARRLRINQESRLAQYGNQSASLAKFIGVSPAIKRVIELALLAAASNSTNVLITGESGVGKEVLARIIHEGGKATKGEFITANCGAIPNSLAESEFFGHVKGAYTGAAYTRSGLFELADKGTLFLDEIADTGLDIQSKLLRALESRQVFRVGSNKPITVDIRVISATNKDLKAMVEEGLFRLDLYYRLNTIEIAIPPLRQRTEDIEPLLDFFVAHFSNKMGKKIPKYDLSLVEYLSEYSFPGNVRELKNMVERALIISSNDLLSPSSFPIETKIQDVKHADETWSESQRLASMEARYIIKVYRACNGNKAQTARKLGISYPTIKRKLKSLGVG